MVVQVVNQDPRQVSFLVDWARWRGVRHWRDSYLLAIAFSGSQVPHIHSRGEGMDPGNTAIPSHTRETRLCAVMAVPSGGEVPLVWHRATRVSTVNCAVLPIWVHINRFLFSDDTEVAA
jgi:hypothetical protein